MLSQNMINKVSQPRFIFEHKIIKEEIEALKHIYFDRLTVLDFLN